MKKIIVLFTALAFFYACSSDNCSCLDEQVYLSTQYLTVNPNQWRTEDSDTVGHFVYATVNLPAITDDVLKSGLVLGYLVENPEKPLPYERYYMESGNLLTETTRFDIQKAKVTFIRERSNLSIPVVSDTLSFKMMVVANYRIP